MDVFAHIASGALLGRAVRPTGPAWAAYTFYGAVAGVSPDVDAPLALAGPDAWAKWHQLYTHSLVGLVWVPLALSLLPFRFAPWRTRFLLALCGWTLHIALDLCSRWPVPVFWPLSSQRWAAELLQQDFSWRIDMLLVTALALTLWDPARAYARELAVVSGFVVAGWLALGLPT